MIMEETNPELEAFRKQWRAEVSARSQIESRDPTSGPYKQARIPPAFTRLLSSNPPNSSDDEEEEDPVESPTFHGLSGSSGTDRREGENSQASSTGEPRSALEHYEKAVERETEGILGDSLNLYRKAFRMDHKVDKAYKNKHFPPSYFSSKPASLNPSNASPTVPNTAHHSLRGHPQTIKELIAGFSGLLIQPAPPAIEGTPAPPCPLAEIPDEILVHIFKDVAILDVASFVRLAQVCKRMAYLVATEEQIWKRVSLGSEVGFGAMHYQWQREVLGEPLKEGLPNFEDFNGEEGSPRLCNDAVTEALLNSGYNSSWHQMFYSRPRIRFNGCYISTINYIRPGQASQSQITWNSPVHIVTYYRFLRFFRDGSVISLLTTTEPTNVVHHLTKELQETHYGGNAAYLPSIVMQKALRGRWRLSNSVDNPEVNLKDSEGDLFVETEGANSRYMYRMKFSLRNAGKGAKSNKLVWQGFWNYNHITGEAGEFTLKNEKAFFFSRVKSYGMGG